MSELLKSVKDSFVNNPGEWLGFGAVAFTVSLLSISMIVAVIQSIICGCPK